MNGLAGFASLWPRASHSDGQAVVTLVQTKLCDWWSCGAAGTSASKDTSAESARVCTYARACMHPSV